MDKKQLAGRIWRSAKNLRSRIEANEYKDYILGFIFYKFLSDREVEFAHREGLTDDDIRDEFNETNADAVSLVQPRLGYFIAFKNLFSTWLDPKSTFDVADVRDALSAFTRFIAPSHKKVFEKIFIPLETGLGKLGDSATTQTRAIKGLFKIIRDIPTDGRQGYDVLGFVYEYLIEQFAANAGKKAGEFYTPHEASLFISEIVASHLKGRKEIKIYDPTSGSGSLLINIGRAVARNASDANGIKYYAQELKENTYNLTRMNLVMRGILPSNIEVRNGDTLERDWPWFDESNPDATYSPLYVDAVVSNPPYSQSWRSAGKESDPRYAAFGLAPAGKADYAFLLHDLYHLKPDGIMAIVLPHGVLYRGKDDDGSEGSIRKALVEGNHIDAVIGLPPNIFFGTSIATIVMVLKKKREAEDTLVVDASLGFIKDGKKNRLRSSDIRKIADVVTARQEIEGYSRLVGRDEIRRNGYNLNITRYVGHWKKEAWDISAVVSGGMPNSEIDAHREWWRVFPDLKRALFTVDGNYSHLKVANIADAVLSARSVRRYQADVAAALSGLDEQMRKALIDNWRKVNINTEESSLAAGIYKRFAAIPLVDKYDTYQILDDVWTLAATDLEILQTEGFDAVRVVEPHYVLKKSGDEEVEVEDGVQGRIIPFPLVQEMFFNAELDAIATTENDIERIGTSLLALAAEVDDADREDVMKENGEEFDASCVKDKAVEIISAVETSETLALAKYIELPSVAEKRSFIESHGEIDWAAMTPAKNGTYNKTDVQRRINQLRVEHKFPDGTFEAIVLRAAALFDEARLLKAQVKRLNTELEDKTIAKIKSLTDAEAKDLLEMKWVRPVVSALAALPQRTFASIADAIGALDKKYATTLSSVETKIVDAEKKLVALFRTLKGNSDDHDGLNTLMEALR